MAGPTNEQLTQVLRARRSPPVAQCLKALRRMPPERGAGRVSRPTGLAYRLLRDSGKAGVRGHSEEIPQRDP
jgi:hypothetical protein